MGGPVSTSQCGPTGDIRQRPENSLGFLVLAMAERGGLVIVLAGLAVLLDALEDSPRAATKSHAAVSAERAPL